MINWKSKRFIFLTLFVVLLGGFLAGYQSDIPVSSLKLKYAKSPSNFTDIMGMNVHYRDVGVATDSLPIVLLHGTGASLHTWQGWVDELSKTRRVITMDLPAFGLTGPNAGNNYSPEFYVEFINEFLTTFNVKRCVLGGNSLGGMIAWQMAVAHPERIKKLILVDAAGYPMESESVPLAFKMAKIPGISSLFTVFTPKFIIANSVRNVYGNPAKATDEIINRYYELSLRAGNRRAFVSRMKSAKYDDQSGKIKQIQQPTLILWGQKDHLIPVANAHRFAANLPNDSLVIYPELGHVPMEENAAETVKTVKGFLKIK